MTATFKLNNGVSIPALGFGVFQTPPDVTAASVVEALQVGYRHVDTASAYGNERGVGEGVRKSGVDRNDIFIESKVWISDYGYDSTLHAFEKATRKLGFDTIDLYILHQPLLSNFNRTIESYRALESLLEDGRVRAIGVSNFKTEHLHRLRSETGTVPAVNQIELHPYFLQREVQAANSENGILTQAWSPMGGVTSYRGSGGPSTFENAAIVGVGKRHGKSPAQVMLRWHLQEGRQSIPKSVRPKRIAENFDIFDFELDEVDLADLGNLDTGVRGGQDPDSITLESTSLTIPDS